MVDRRKNVQRDKVQRKKGERMKAQRKRFSAIAKMVKQMRAEGSKKTRKQLWKIATQAYERFHIL